MRKNLANFFTLLNLLFGCLAIINIFEVDYYYSDELNTSTWVIIPEKMYLVSFFIFAAGLCDFLDGFIARWLKIESPLGLQLDSLADIVSFGVAPGLIVFKFLNQSLSNLIIKEPYSIMTKLIHVFQPNNESNFAPFIFLLPAFIIPLAAAYRLATYNLSTDQTKNFKGLPTPAVGFLIATYPLIFWQPQFKWVFLLFNNSTFFWYLNCLGLGYLMLSRRTMLAFKNFGADSLKKYLWIVIGVIGLIMTIIWQWLGLAMAILGYILGSFIYEKIQIQKQVKI